MAEYSNTFLLLILAVILITLRPWEHLRWLTLFVLMTAVGFLIYKLIPFPNIIEQYYVYGLLRYIYYLLLLGAVAEILRLEFDKRPPWIYAAFALIAFSLLFLPNGGFYFYVPRVILLAGIAFSLPLAFRGKSLPLIALSIMTTGDLISDIVKFSFSISDPSLESTFVRETITLIQTIIDPMWSTICSLLLISGAVWTVMLRLKQKEPAAENGFSAGLAIAGDGIAEDVVVPFPRKINGLDISPDDDPEGIDMFLKAAAVASALQSKDYFSLQEVAIYLSATPEYAEQFLETHAVKKIYPVQGDRHWVVAKSSIDDILQGKKRS